MIEEKPAHIAAMEHEMRVRQMILDEGREKKLKEFKAEEKCITCDYIKKLSTEVVRLKVANKELESQLEFAVDDDWDAFFDAYDDYRQSIPEEDREETK